MRKLWTLRELPIYAADETAAEVSRMTPLSLFPHFSHKHLKHVHSYFLVIELTYSLWKMWKGQEV